MALQSLVVSEKDDKNDTQLMNYHAWTAEACISPREESLIQTHVLLDTYSNKIRIMLTLRQGFHRCLVYCLVYCPTREFLSTAEPLEGIP